jgi:hypothetical protein
MWTRNQPGSQIDIKHKGPEECQERCWQLETLKHLLHVQCVPVCYL